MPKVRLNNSQRMTMGAYVLAIFVIPSGWTRKTTTRMAQVTPMTVDVWILELTTVILAIVSFVTGLIDGGGHSNPWMAPRID